MSDVELKLSVGELKLCSGACLTYSGVPFHRVEKTRTSAADLEQLDRLFHSLIDARRPTRNLSEIPLSEADILLLVDVLTAILQEHEPPDKHSDYNLQLHVGPRTEVQSALNKLRSIQQRLQVA